MSVLKLSSGCSSLVSTTNIENRRSGRKLGKRLHVQALHQKRSRRDFLNVSIGGLYLAAFSPEAQAESSDELGGNLPSFPNVGEILKNRRDSENERYRDLDERAKASPWVQSLLKKSEQNREKNFASIQAKYCARGAEWGVGDCSLQGVSKEEREAFRKAMEEAAEKLLE